MFNGNYCLKVLNYKNNRLKSRLRYFQLKNNTFKSNRSRLLMKNILKEYRTTKSLVVSAKNLGLDKSIPIKYYIGGQMGIPEFRKFYLEINRINEKDLTSETEVIKEYKLKKYENSWIYTVFIDGTKISLISSDYDRMIEKIRNKRLPL